MLVFARVAPGYSGAFELEMWRLVALLQSSLHYWEYLFQMPGAFAYHVKRILQFC